MRKDAFWFGESQSRILVSVSENNIKEFKKMLDATPYENLGYVTNGEIEIDGVRWGRVDAWKEKYDTAIENYFKHYIPE